MTLLVRDEQDILEKNICFHLNHGVDFIVATDNGSIDHTPYILEKYKKNGVLAYKTINTYTYEQSAWVSDMAEVAVKEYGATHLFHCDADEFWFPQSGNLKDVLPEENQVFFVPVINYLPTHLGIRALLRKQTIVAKPFPDVAQRGEKSSKTYLLHIPHPKIMTTAQFTHIAQGNHTVITSQNFKRVNMKNIHIHHFPVRSYATFETKVVNGGSSYEKNPNKDPNMGWQWKEWYEYYKVGMLPTVYKEMCLDADEKKILIHKGILQEIRIPRSIPLSEYVYTYNNLRGSTL